MTVKSKLLEMLEQHKGEVISGESVAAKLGCTRAAVWKAVKSLREEGYTIEAGPNKGYMLARETNRLSPEGIRLYLDHPEVSIIIYDEVDSTNQAAKREAIGGKLSPGSFVIARKQTAGRGRRGRSFYSPEDAGLYMSVILKPEGTVKDSLVITTAAATAVYRAVKQVCGISLDIKWVNDLLYHNRKVCGILTEAVTDFESGTIEFIVVGIGLNIYQDPSGFPEDIRDTAGTLYESSTDSDTMDINRLAAVIVNELQRETAGMKISDEYIKNNIIPGNLITISDGQNSRQAFAMNICPDGRLRVKEKNGKESILSYGEVSVSII